jgi:hypothetical protein
MEKYGCELFSFIDLNPKKNNDFNIEKDPIFEHFFLHLKAYLNEESNKTDKSTQMKLVSEFIEKKQFDVKILKSIVIAGIPNNLFCLRPLIWKALIGYLPIDNLSKWKDVTKLKFNQYLAIRKKYKDYPNNITNESDLAILKQIDKDLPRTRVDTPLFKDKSQFLTNEINYDVLRRILYYYAKENEEVKYIQGMNEIIAIIFYIFSSDENPFIKPFIESDSYFTFSLLLKEIKHIFIMDNISFSQLLVKKLIDETKEILLYLEPALMKFFDAKGVDIQTFLIRWILVLFAQEFNMGTSVVFWDRIFTSKSKLKFMCYVCSAVLRLNKKKILKMEMEGIITWSQNFGTTCKNHSIDEIIGEAYKIKAEYKKKEAKSKMCGI